MRIVFWLDPKVGFDWSTPEIITTFADGLAGMGYEVELLIKEQTLDDYRTEHAVRRIWSEEGNQQIIADVLITNRLENLLRHDLYQAGEKLWLALEEDLLTTHEYFENYRLYEEIGVFTLNVQIKEKLNGIGIEALHIRPGLCLTRYKVSTARERENRQITIGIFDSRPEVIKNVLQGIEMTRAAMSRLEIHLLTDREIEIKSNIPLHLMVKPAIEERMACYQKSDLFIYIPGSEKMSLLPIEAMACGLPSIILQNVAVQSYARQRQNCLMLGKLHPKGLALAILNIVKIGNIREQLRSQGLRSSLDFDIESSLKNLEQLWSESSRTKSDSTISPEDGGGGELVDIILVNYNSGGKIKDSLFHLRKYTEHPHRLIVVDNGSTDESIDDLKQEKGISLILNKQNNGFAGACNQGILAGKGQYIVLMGTTTKVTDGWLTPLITAARKPDAAMVLPRIIKAEELARELAEEVCDEEVVDSLQLETVDINDEIQSESGLIKDIEEIFQEGSQDSEANPEILAFPTKPALPAKPKPEITLPHIGPQGRVCLIKRDLLNRLGLFDERFFLFYEDLDYSLRVEEKGYRVLHSEQSIIVYDSNLESCSSNEEERSQRNKSLAQGRQYLKEKWGELSPDICSERKADGFVILSLNPYQKRAQRTDAMLNYFTNCGHKIVYVEPYCSSRAPEIAGEDQYIYTLKGNGTIYSNLTNSGRIVEMIHELKTQLIQWGVYTPVLWVESPWWEPLLKHFEHRLLIYITPEILLGEELESFQQLREKFTKTERSLVKAADIVITASRKRQEEMELTHPRVFYYPGGFYPTHLERFLKGHFTMPDDLVQLEGYKVGIIGTLNRYFPRNLLRDLANKHSGVSFIFIGDITCDSGELAKIPNLYFLKNKGWEHLLDCLYFFDLVLYPYNYKGLNTYLDPFMVNYYLAMGKPVVAFQHTELERFGRALKVGENESEFFEVVAQTLQQLDDEKNDVKIKERLHQVRGHSWDEQFIDLYEEVKNVFVTPELTPVPIPEEPRTVVVTKESPLAAFWRQIQDSYQKLRGSRKYGADQ